MSTLPSVALIGFGEVGQVLAADLRAGGAQAICAWDLKFGDAGSAPSIAARRASVRIARDAADAAGSASVVLSAVTAAECTAAACSAAPALAAGAFYVDLNSVSPGTRTDAALVIGARGGRFVEAAVMSPIRPRRIAAPILLGGPHADAFLPMARTLGFGGAEAFSPVLGRASAAKMCRSVIVKGMEALLAESLLAARRYQVDATVLDSLQGLLPAADWPSLARYMISRSLAHGARRAEEMREVAKTVKEAGLEPWMSAACAERQDWAAAFGDEASREPLAQLLDALLARIPDTQGGADADH